MSRAITGTGKDDRPYSHRTGAVLVERANSTIEEVIGRPDLVAKFPRRPEALAREQEVYGIFRAQKDLPEALTAYRGAGADHVLVARMPHSAYRERLRDEQLMSVAQHLAAAVGRLVSLGIVHADLTPSNVLLDAGRSVPYVIDFGSALLSRGDQLRPKRGTGSPWPVPEVYRHRHEDDVWSMSWILLHLRDPTSYPTTDGRVPGFLDSVDKPIVALLNELGNLGDARSLQRSLYRLRISCQAQIHSAGPRPDALYTPSPGAQQRVADVAQRRRAEFLRAIETLDPGAFASTVHERVRSGTTPAAQQAGTARASAVRRFLRRFLGEVEVGNGY